MKTIILEIKTTDDYFGNDDLDRLQKKILEIMKVYSINVKEVRDEEEN